LMMSATRLIKFLGHSQKKQIFHKLQKKTLLTAAA
jgi:hypothetical protein